MSEETEIGNAGFDAMFNTGESNDAPTNNEAAPITGTESQGVTPEVQDEVSKLWADGHPDGDKKEASNEEKRFQYWQSQADKYKNELDSIKAKNEELSLYAPVAQYLNENPNALTALEQVIQGNANQAPTQQSAEPELVKPEAPQMPDDYDPDDRFTRGTAAYKYHMEKENYQQKLLDFYDSRDAQREAKMQRQLEMDNMSRQQQAQQMQLSQQLATQYRMNPAEIADFQNMMAKPNANLNDFVEFYRFKKGMTNMPNNAIDQFANRQTKLNIPPPLGVQTGQATPTLNDEDMFNLGAIKEWQNPNRGY